MFYFRIENLIESCFFYPQFVDDTAFGVDTNRLVDLRVRNNLSTTYVYRFSLRDEYSLSPVVDPEQSNGGVQLS